jgi:hypothetical protein
MKRIGLSILIALLCLARVSFAQSSHTLSYQGYVTGTDGLPVQDANCPVHVEILNADDGNSVIWSDDLNVPVKDGLLNLELGTHNPLPASAQLDHKLAVGVRLRGSPPLISPITATPYALNVPDGAITSGKLADGVVTDRAISVDYVKGIRVNGERVTSKGSELNIITGNGIRSTFIGTSNTLVLQGASNTLTVERWRFPGMSQATLELVPLQMTFLERRTPRTFGFA